ncbi:hypothetical protein DFS33DRAFT_1276886 [Desarmillaria ectypa]|nr:hypothetical protein DFS33DRAFT_1276886 [Desarmillaria ectypa]
MSDQPSPPVKPKPGSLRDRIAAFEKPTNVSTPGPTPVPRPKPGAVSWKPRAPSPPSMHPGGDSSTLERRTGGMSASDAKESIGKGGSLKERMAALQGRGAFGAPPPPVVPKPAIERPKWKPPPPVASPPPDDRLEKDDVTHKSPEILSKSPDSIPAQPSPPIEGEPDAPAVAVAVPEPEGQAADEADPEDEERQRRATIAARMARLGGARVGMGPPVFGKVPVKPKPKAELVEEETKPVEGVSPPPPSGEDEALKSAPTSPPLGEGAGSKALDVGQPDEDRSSESLLTPPDADVSSPSVARTPASMPVPAGPRRAAPPRRRPAKSPVPPLIEDRQKNRESLTSLDITSHPISDSEGAPKEEPLSVVTEPVLESPTEATSSRTADEMFVSPHVVEADVADIRVSPESPSLQGHIDLLGASTEASESISQELSPDDTSDVPVEKHPSPTPEPSIPSVEEEEEEKEEEDEEARHNRITERIAKMGGINPFAPPPLQRRLSTTSNVSDAVAPPSPTIQKRTSVGSISKSPERKLNIRKPSIDEAPVEEQTRSIPPPPRRRSSQFSEKSPALAIVSPPTRTHSVDSATSGEQIRADLKRRSQDDAITVQDEPEPRFPIGITEELESFEEEISEKGAAAMENQTKTNWDTESVDEDQRFSTHDGKTSSVIEGQDEINDDDTRLPQQATSGPPPPLPASNTRPLIPASESVAALPPPYPRRLSIQRVDEDDVVVISPKRTSISPPLAITTEVEDGAISAVPPQRSVPPPPSVEHDSPISPTSPLQIPPPRSFSILQSQAAEEDDETTPLPHPGPFHRSVPPQQSLSQSTDQSEIETPPVPAYPHPHRSIPPVPAEEVESDHEAIPLPPPPPRGPSPASEEQPLIIPPPVRRESMKIPPGLEVNRRPHTPPMLTPTVSVSDHSSEQEILDEEEGDPIDPTFHSPSRRASYNNIQEPSGSHIREPASPSPSVSSHIREPAATSATVSAPAAAAATSPAPVVTEPALAEEPIEAEPEQERRRTIAERMAKLGGIKFGAAPIPTSQPPPPPQRTLEVQERSAGEEEPQSTEEPEEEEEEEEEERARKERIAAKLASMGGMRIGMMPLGASVLTPSSPGPSQVPPHPPVRAPPMPRAPPPTEIQETDSEQESQATSDDVDKVEAEEESEAEDVQYEEADEVPEEIPPPPIPTREGRRASVQRQMSTDVPLASPQVATQSPSSPPPPPPPGRPPVPTANLPRRTSVQTVTSIKSSHGDSGADPHLTHRPQYDFVMVEEPEAQDIPPKLVTRPPPPTGAPPPPPPFSDNTPPRMELSDSVSSQWELPSIPSSSLEFGSGGTMSVSWTDDVVEATTAVPAPAPEIIKPTKSQEDAVLTSEELIAIWGRIGVQVCEVATSLHDKSRKALIGDGTYHGFIEAVLHEVPGAAPPTPPSYGYVIYMQSGSSVQKRAGEIMPGDVVWLSDAKLKGHKGIQTYSQHVGVKEPLVGIISEFEAKKFKLRVFQANQHVGQQTVESVSYRLEDLKSGAVKVFRILEA